MSFFLLISILVLPWYIVAVVGLICLISFHFYFEVILVAYMYEVLYSRVNDPFFTLKFLPIVIVAFIVWNYFMYDYLRFGEDE